MPYNLEGYKLEGYRLITPSGPDTDESLVLNTATTIVVLDGRTYTKTNVGWALVAYFYAYPGYTGPCIVSDVEANASYNGYPSSGSVEYNGTTYYYGNMDLWMGGDHTDTSGYNRVKLTATSYPAAAIELLDRYFRNGY